MLVTLDQGSKEEKDLEQQLKEELELLDQHQKKEMEQMEKEQNKFETNLQIKFDTHKAVLMGT